MANVKDITGKKFNKLTAVSFSHKIKKGKNYYSMWNFVCDCGNKKIISKYGVTRGITKSCGCLLLETRLKFGLTSSHHMSRTRFYRIFKGLQQRCENNKNKNFNSYGGRGIMNEWKTFEIFRDDMFQSYSSHCNLFGEKQTTIERIDNNGNYCKENCKWATYKEQVHNRRQCTYKNNGKLCKEIEFNGLSKNMSEWSRITGIKRTTIGMRIKNYGWLIEKALTTK